MTLFTYIQRPKIRVLIYSYDKFVHDKTRHESDYYYSAGEWIHTLLDGRLLPKGTFQSNPEYFALIKGERSANQPCWSSDGLLQLTIGQVSKIDTDKIISVSMGDSFDFCECDKCKGRKPSEAIVTFMNAIGKRFPNKQFSTLCYYPAQIPTVKPLRNVQIMLTTITVTKDEPIETGKRGEAVEFRRDLRGWLRLTDNVLIWDYTCQFHHLLMPYPVIHSIAANIKFYARLGVRQFIIQNNSWVGHEFSELKSHLIAELMYNPCLNVDKLINDFGANYYGKGWPSIRQYIDLLEANQQKDGSWLSNWGGPKDFEKGFLSRESLRVYEGILKSARIAAEVDKKERVDSVRLQVLYVLILQGWATELQKMEFANICELLGEVTINENNESWKGLL